MRMYFLPILLFSLTSTRALTLIFDIHVQHGGFSKMGTSCGQTVVMEVDDTVSTSTYQAEVTDPAQHRLLYHTLFLALLFIIMPYIAAL